jgi:multidrug efflux pump subunit AcrB
MPVTYVIGDVAGLVESPVYAILQMNKALQALDTREFGGNGSALKIYNAVQPFTEDQPSLKWDGEWHLTIELFRDLGTAFAAVLVLIFILMVGWFRSFLTPLVVMAAIPFSLVGILPAHGLMGAFFSATSMIGFMAGAGIVVRNSIILVDFIEQRLAEGMPLAQAVVDAGAVRFRPMLLTASAVVVGASVMLADPIFKGLAISLMAGEIASLLISRMAVPVLYFMAHNRASLLEQSHLRILPPCLPHGDSHIEQNQSLPSAPMIPGIRFPDAVPILGKENNCAASDLTTADNSSR